MEVAASESPTLTRQSTDSFSCLLFSSVQRQSTLLQPFKLLTVLEQALPHCATVVFSAWNCTDHGGSINLVRDHTWVDGLEPNDQGGANRMKRGTLFGLGGRDW